MSKFIPSTIKYPFEVQEIGSLSVKELSLGNSNSGTMKDMTTLIANTKAYLQQARLNHKG